jgi:ATP-binding cassette subfamily F protein 3
VAIVGINGAGKTTLLKLLAGAIAPSSGDVIPGHQVKIGYYAQHQAESLDMSKTVFEEMQETAPEMPITQLRAIAGAFLFSGDAVEKRCSVLSGGEKARVALAKLLLTPANFLVLDEPTNHLDVESRGILLDALQDYTGTLCLVSHDRAFISPLVDSVLEIQVSANGSNAIPLLGSYDDYLEYKVREAKSVIRARLPEKNKDSRPSDSSNQKRKWERERERLESEITDLEKKQAALSELLSDTKTYEDKEKSVKCIEEQKFVQNQLTEKLSRWERLCELLSSA